MIRRDYDGINTLLVKEKKAGCTNWRTKTVYTLKPTAIHQIISEREYTYSGCSTMTSWADRWYHYDLLGSVTALTDGDGQVIAQYEQDAYGNVLSGTTPGLNRHLTGKELDPDTGLYYFGARWYDPRTAQWVEPEPTGADGWNLYTFAGLNPLYWNDPDGLRLSPRDEGRITNACSWMGGAVGAIIGGLVTRGNTYAEAAGGVIGGTVGLEVGYITVDLINADQFPYLMGATNDPPPGSVTVFGGSCAGPAGGI